MTWGEAEIKIEEGRWVVRLGPVFVVLLEAKPELLNQCPQANEKLDWILKQPF